MIIENIKKEEESIQKNAQSKEEKSGAEILVESLVKQGVEVIFGYPGGSILTIYDALYRNPNIQHILTKHEQAAIHAAQGYARSTGKVGVVFATSGPGATNIVTGLGDAMADQTPLVCITGQVASHKIGTDAFQEGDIISITRPVTKHSYLIKDVEKLEKIVEKSFEIATSNRPGPVLIDVPSDIQAQKTIFHDFDITPYTQKPKTTIKASKEDILKAIEMMKKAERPIFYCGGGVVASGNQASQNLHELVKKTGFPITLTLMGLGAFPASDDQFLGMLGMYGTYESNLAMHDADLIITIGARFDDRITGDINKFAPHAKIIQMDIDPYNINKIISVDHSILCDAESGISMLSEAWDQNQTNQKDINPWMEKINKWRTEDCLSYVQDEKTIKQQTAILSLDKQSKEKDIYITTDVGLHQMWVAQYFGFDKPKRLVTSGGYGTMGFGLPAAMGVQAAHKDAQVVCISGDGSILMNIQELVTLRDYNIPVKIMVLNNATLGMVRQWQDMFYGKRRAETEFPNRVDLEAVAKAFDIEANHVTEVSKLDEAIKEMLDAKGPYLLEVATCSNEDIFPFIPPGKAHNEVLLRKDVQNDR